MQKIINGIALLSGAVSIAVVGSVGYLYLNKDAIIEDIKGKVMESVMPDIGSGITDAIPSFTGPATSVPKSPMPVDVGLGVPSF